MVDSHVQSQAMQVPGAAHFGSQHFTHAISIHIADHGVIQNHGGMQDTGQRCSIVLQIVQQGLHIASVGDVACNDLNLRAQLDEFSYRYRSTRGVQTPATDEH